MIAAPMGSVFDHHYLLVHGQARTDDESRAEALAAVWLAGVPPGGRLLDAPCGFGRHALPLAGAGYEVAGLDLSEPLLTEARRRVGAPGNPTFVHGDLRALPFEESSFDAVLCLDNSLGYHGEQGDVETLREFRRVLREGGRLVLEVYPRDRLARELRGWVERRLPDGSVVTARSTFDVLTGVLAVTETRLEQGVAVSQRGYEQRIYAPTELGRLVRAAGFRTIGCCADLRGGRPALDSPALVVVAG